MRGVAALISRRRFSRPGPGIFTIPIHEWCECFSCSASLRGSPPPKSAVMKPGRWVVMRGVGGGKAMCKPLQNGQQHHTPCGTAPMKRAERMRRRRLYSGDSEKEFVKNELRREAACCFLPPLPPARALLAHDLEHLGQDDPAHVLVVVGHHHVHVPARGLPAAV